MLLDNKATNISVLDLRTVRNRFPGVEYFDGDITSATEVSALLQKVKPQVIIHTASPTAMLYNTALFDRVNVGGTDNLLKCAGEAGTVKAFVYTSSASVVHDTRSDLVFADESYPVLRLPEQQDYYSYTKGIADTHVLEANRKYGDMLTISIRPAGIFGEGDVQNLPPVIENYWHGSTNWQLGDNSNYFDFTYVVNIAHAHLLAAQALLETHSMKTRPLDHEKVDGEAFFITNDEPILFWDYARAIWTLAGWKGSARDAWIIPKKVGIVLAYVIEWVVWIFTLGMKEPRLKPKIVRYSTMTRTYSVDKAKKRLGYKPLVSLRDGLKRGVDWYVESKREERQKSEEKKEM